jgi:integrase
MSAALRELKTIHDVILTYLPQARRDMADHAYYERQRLLEKIDRELGHLNIADAKPFDLHNWLNEHTEYRSPWSVQHVITSVKRAFNYCLEMELIIRNPFARIKKPKGQRRRPLTDQEYQTLLRGSDPQLRRLVVFLAMSGCRPAEATGMRWADVHFDQNSVILKIHKTSKATGGYLWFPPRSSFCFGAVGIDRRRLSNWSNPFCGKARSRLGSWPGS